MRKGADYLEDCLSQIGEKFSWGPPTEWTNYNFDLLSNEIQKDTGVAISNRTLRRLANRRIKYTPQPATKNALAMYLGHDSWESFLQSKKRPAGKNRNANMAVNTFIFRYFWLILFLIIVGLSSFFVFFYPSIELGLNKSKVVFQSNNATGTAPHSASFFYDVTKIRSSNVYLDHNYYDEGEIIPVKKNMHYYTNTFELPDYYAVKIIAKGERLACVGVHVVTEGWATVINDELRKDLDPVSEDGQLHLSKEDLAGLTVNEDSMVIVDFRNIRDFGIMGDNMTLETRFRNNADLGGAGCYGSKIEVINKHGRLSFNFVTPGCEERLLKAEFGDVFLAGEFNNLNTFIQDISYWRVLKIVSGKRRVGVYLDDVQVYSVRYNDPLDDVKGISISFMGSGAVDYVRLYNEHQELVYNDDFVNPDRD